MTSLALVAGHKQHFPRHPECHSVKCAHHADALWNAKRRKQRERREARELSEGWAIPEYVVRCESDFQNLPPNSADASGYYQILGAASPYGDTWKAFGGGAPYEAYLHSKAEQGRVARRIWVEAGPSQWDCA